VLVLFFSFLGCIGVSTQGLILARQVVFHLSHVLPCHASPPPQALFCFSYFTPGAGLRMWTFYLPLPLSLNYRSVLPYLTCLLLTFFLCWPWAMILWVSSSQIAGIKGISHHAQPACVLNHYAHCLYIHADVYVLRRSMWTIFGAFELRVFVLARQVLYLLSHALSPFCF
jgi:hypothetical protein